MSEQDEVKWLQGLRVGDDRAFKVLFEKYYASLCAFATNFVNDPDVAEDIVQEIFFKLYTDKPTFDVVVALKSYLYLVTKNQCLNYLKHARIEQEYMSFLKERETTTFFFNQIVEQELLALLSEAIHEYLSVRETVATAFLHIVQNVGHALVHVLGRVAVLLCK